MSISARQYEALKQRVSGRKRTPTPAVSGTAGASSISPHGIILGIDPSLRGTGYGVIRWARHEPRALCHGTITAPSAWPHSRCLVQIAVSLRDIIQRHQPEVCVMEGLFYAQNLKTALTMGEARGAALTTVAEAGLTIYEIAPRKMKQAIVGYGAARKEAVARMVQRMLRLSELPEPDAADALALALAHGQEMGRPGLLPPKPI